MSVDEQLLLEQDLALAAARRGMLGFAAYVYEGMRIHWHHRLVGRALNYLREGRTPRELLASLGIVGKELERQLAEPHPNTGLYAGMTSPAMLDDPLVSLQVALPPRHSKSMMVSTLLPGFWLGHEPDARIIAASYGASLAEELAGDAIKILASGAYARVFPDTRLGMGTQNNVRAKMTRTAFDVADRRGKYRATSVSGPLTGLASDLSVIDDPHKDRLEASSSAIREQIWRWYTSTLYTRGQKGVRRVVAATRWHEDDLSGRLLERARKDPLADQWFCITLPAILDCAPGPGDPRQPGEALWPEEFPVEQLHKIRATQGAYEFEALYQQRPAPQEGGVVKDAWWMFYEQLPNHVTDWTISVDLAFKNKKDFSCFQVWCCRGADRYLVDMVMERIEFTDQLRAFKALCAKWPQCRTKLVEDAANGAALVSTLKREISGIIPVTVRGSKQLRAEAVAPQIESGNVHLPSPRLRPWVEDFLSQWRAFGSGGGAHDDAVDACSQVLNRLSQRRVELGGVPIGVGERPSLTGHVTRRIPGVRGPL